MIFFTLGLVRFLFCSALVFFYVFNLSFASAPTLSSGRVAFLVMAFIWGRRALPVLLNAFATYRLEVLAFLILVIFALIWFAINGAYDNTMLSRVTWFIVFSFVGSFFYMAMCRFDLNAAMSYYLAAVSVQAALVYFSVLNPGFRELVDVLLPNSGNIDFSEGVRFSGFSNGGGATLAVQLAFGVASAFVLFYRNKGKSLRLFLLLISIVIAGATIFVGRTGLYLSLVFFIGFVFFSGRAIFVPIFLICLVVLSANFIPSLSSDRIQFDDNDIKLDRTVGWAFDIFLTGESDSSKALITDLAKTRDLTPGKLLVGSGRVVNHDGTNYSGHDSGYLHSLYALGLPLSIVFYCALLFVFIRPLRKVSGRLRYIGYFFVLIVFVLELKEPFVFKYTVPFFVLVFIYLSRDDVRAVLK